MNIFKTVILSILFTTIGVFIGYEYCKKQQTENNSSLRVIEDTNETNKTINVVYLDEKELEYILAGLSKFCTQGSVANKFVVEKNSTQNSKMHAQCITQNNKIQDAYVFKKQIEYKLK